MNRPFRLLGLAVVVASALAAGACGPDDKLHLANDGGGAGSDGGPTAGTLTSYVIDLVMNHTSDPTPAPYTAFGTLPDPDGSDNNTAAYSGLFQ